MISEIENISSLSALRRDLTKLKGGKNFWRIKIGDYRVGIEVEGDTVILVRILRRKDIYRYFP